MSTRKLASASLANLVVPLTGLAVSPFLSRELGPAGRGLYAAFTLPVIVYGWAGTYGLQDALTVHLRDGRLTTRQATRAGLIASVPLGLIGVGLLTMLGVGTFAGNGTHYTQFLVLSLLVPLQILANLLIGTLTGASDVRGVNLVKVVPALVRTALVIAGCVAFDLDAFWAALLIVASTVPGVAVGLARAVRAPGRPTGTPTRIPTDSLVGYSLRCLPGVLAAVSTARLDQVIGLPVIGARQLGYYAVAVSVAEIPMVIATAARTVSMGRPGTTDPRQATRVGRIAVLASAASCALLAVSAPVAVPWFFGPAFAPAVVPTVILCAGTVMYTCVVLLSAVLLVNDRAGWSSTALVGGCAVGIVLLFVLSPLGATGAALASLAGYGVSVAVAAPAVRTIPHLRSLRMLTVPYGDDLRYLAARTVARIPGIVEAYRRTGFPTVGVAALLVLAWLRIQVPDLIQVLGTGRVPFNARTAVSAASDTAGNAISLAFLMVAAVLVARGLHRRRTDHLRWLAVALAPLLAIAISGLVNHDPPSLVWGALPLAAVAIWLQPPRPGVLAVIGILDAVTAAGSVLLALVRPDLAVLSGSASGTKTTFLGGLLAGWSPHSNALGIALALGLPFVFCVRNISIRRAALAVILFALVWTESRTSQLAAVAVLLTYALIRRYPTRSWLLSVPVAAGLVLIVSVPLVGTDPHRFTERGRIWAVLLHRWAQHPVLGLGPGYFERTPGLARALGGQFTHGHNLMVQLLVVGGLLAVALFAVLTYLTWRQSLSWIRAGQPAPALFLVALVFVSWLEASHVSTTLAGHLLWLPLFLVARLGLDLGRPAPPDRATGPSDSVDLAVSPPVPAQRDAETRITVAPAESRP